MLRGANVEDQIRSAMDKWNKVVAEGNLEGLSEILSHDQKLVFFDANGFKYIGYDSVVKAFEEWFRTMRIHHTSKEIIINSSGNVAWVADDQDLRIVDSQGKVLMDTPLKWTSVLKKNGGKWVFVQIHHSAPAKTYIP